MVVLVVKTREKTHIFLMPTSCRCLTFMTSSSADLHSVDSETSTTDPSSCTATTLTGTDTVLPVRMAVLRTSVSCMHTQLKDECYKSKNHTEAAGVRPKNQKPSSERDRYGEQQFLGHTLWAPCNQWCNNFLSQKLCLDHQVLVLTDIQIYSIGANLWVWLLWKWNLSCNYVWRHACRVAEPQRFSSTISTEWQHLIAPLCPKPWQWFGRWFPGITITAFFPFCFSWKSSQLSQLSLFWT